MNVKKTLFTVFVLVSIAQIVVPLYMVYGKEKVAAQGVEFKFKCAPRDPYDPFRGKYVVLSFEAETYNKKISDSKAEVLRDVTAWAIIDVDNKGFVKITDVVLNKPAGAKHYIKIRASQWIYDGKEVNVSLEFPFCEYYMNEDKASLAETAYWSNQSKAYVTVRVMNGDSVMTGLYIDGVPVEQYVQKHQKRQRSVKCRFVGGKFSKKDVA